LTGSKQVLTWAINAYVRRRDIPKDVGLGPRKRDKAAIKYNSGYYSHLVNDTKKKRGEMEGRQTKTEKGDSGKKGLANRTFKKLQGSSRTVKKTWANGSSQVLSVAKRQDEKM